MLQNPPFCPRDSKQIQLRERANVGGRGLPASSTETTSCTMSSHRISTEKDRNLLAIYSTAKNSKSNTLPGARKKGVVPPFSNFSFQTVKGTPDWPLGSISLHLSMNAADTSALISKTTKRGQGKGLILKKKCNFGHFFLLHQCHLLFNPI